MRECSEDGCERSVRARGLCNKHYLRWWRESNPEYHRETMRKYREEAKRRAFFEVAQRRGVRVVSTEEELREAHASPMPFLALESTST